MTVHTNVEFTEFTLGTVDPSLTLSRIRQLNDKTLGSFCYFLTLGERASANLPLSIATEIGLYLLRGSLSLAYSLWGF